jgi:peptide/nickel transport system substrate-binding protein
MMDHNNATVALSRRTFLATTSAALLGAAMGDLVSQSEAAKPHPKRGGVLQFGTRLDADGLDSNRHQQYHVSHPLAAMYTGLTDIDQQGNIVPGIAESWEPNKEITSWVFRLRKGVLFHNGREVDAEAVKLNIMRIKDPAVGWAQARGALESIATVDAMDKYTVRFNLTTPDVTLPSNLMHYPINLQAPDNFDKAAEHPIGTGPFKFVSWTRFNETKLVRFENYWETDAEGNNLPYLQEIIGKPKREDSVRLTALRTGQINLIENMAFADVERFQKEFSAQYNAWHLHHGGVFVVFNFRQGPFQDKTLRMAAAHAIDRQAIHHSVFYKHGVMLDQVYPPGNPWHLEGIRSLEYDPDKAKSLLKQAKAVGTAIELICFANLAYNRESAQIVQEMWNSVGFKVNVKPLERVPLLEAQQKGDFHGMIQGNAYRFDPDGLFARNLHSKSEYAQSLAGWKNERYDTLVEEAKRTLDQAKRKALYTEAWNIVQVDLPHFHLHDLPMTSAAAKQVKGYQPCQVGPFTHSGGGIRTAYIEA